MDVLDLHARHDGPVTLGLFRTPDPRSSGIVTTAPDGRVTAFVEKPEHPVGDLANAGLYLARHSLLDELASTPMPADGILDFGLHVFPRLVGRARAVPTPASSPMSAVSNVRRRRTGVAGAFPRGPRT
jgi:mannose-1-phosphate guanylyltransferase